MLNENEKHESQELKNANDALKTDVFRKKNLKARELFEIE